mmetsp:Transcript_807/g.1170  ORF Transcript_807/g.1170 Transcript_807/m.1170 type:complete len:239 (-) Transcript_807:73-789(-)
MMTSSSLLYGTTPHIPTWEHICCEVPQHYAEPRGFQEREGIDFFGRLENMQQAMETGQGSVADAAGVDSLSGIHLQWNEATATYEFVFYDSQCGLPIYIAPRGRTYAVWKKESIDHGWPSFRDEEVIMSNIGVIAGGEVVTNCPDGAQTHQGHRFHDIKGYRYCIDVMCMAGHPIDGVDLSEYGFNGTQSETVGDTTTETPMSSQDGSMENEPSLAGGQRAVGASFVAAAMAGFLTLV